jgi:hypothetical protein
MASAETIDVAIGVVTGSGTFEVPGDFSTAANVHRDQKVTGVRATLLVRRFHT